MSSVNIGISGGEGAMMKLNGVVMVSEGGQWRPATAEEAQRYEESRAAYRASREQRRASGGGAPNITIGDVVGGNKTTTTIIITGTEE